MASLDENIAGVRELHPVVERSTLRRSVVNFRGIRSLAQQLLHGMVHPRGQTFKEFRIFNSVPKWVCFDVIPSCAASARVCGRLVELFGGRRPGLLKVHRHDFWGRVRLEVLFPLLFPLVERRDGNLGTL